MKAMRLGFKCFAGYKLARQSFCVGGANSVFKLNTSVHCNLIVIIVVTFKKGLELAQSCLTY